MNQPKIITNDMVLCAECKKPIHIDDFAMVDGKGLYHKSCMLLQGFVISIK